MDSTKNPILHGGVAPEAPPQHGMVGGGNPFFRSFNQSYGEAWQASGGANPQQLQETPEYRELVSGALSSYKDIEKYDFLTFEFLGRKRHRFEELIENIQA